MASQHEVHARYGGVVNNMPKYALVFMIMMLASVGLPGTSGFVGEFLILLGAFQDNTWVATLATTGQILWRLIEHHGLAPEPLFRAAGIDPNRSTMFVQSEVPAIDELTFFFAMLIPFNRVMRNPTLKTEIESKGLGDTYSFGIGMSARWASSRTSATSPARR